MNIKKYLTAVIVLFIFIWGYEGLVHGMLLSGIYTETASIWRPYAEMKAYVPFNLMIIAFLSLWLTFIFTRLFPEGGRQNGLHFGLYFGVLSALQAAAGYFYLPIPAVLAGYWFAAYLIESLIGGLIIGSLYRR